ncbi:MAG: hypothetical protein WAW83_09290, partial [Trichococcus flocculiformis]
VNATSYDTKYDLFYLIKEVISFCLIIDCFWCKANQIRRRFFVVKEENRVPDHAITTSRLRECEPA